MTRALVIIDMQMMMQQRMDAGRDLVNPDAPQNIAALASAFREKGWPLIHVRHRDTAPSSPMHPSGDAYPPMACAQAKDGEAVFEKTTSSAFASTDLEAHLRARGLQELVVTGAVAGFCVNSAVRAGADLGFNMIVARDAVLGFDLPDAGLSAQTIFDVTMAQLAADFATLADTAALLDGL